MNDDKDIPIEPQDDHVALLYPSRYLKKEDLRGKDVTLTISKVALRDVRTTGDDTERKVCVHFEEMQNRPASQRKVWIVPKTVATQLAEMYGEPKPSQWKGRKVTLWPDMSVMAFGKRVGGIRVRPQVATTNERQPGED